MRPAVEAEQIGIPAVVVTTTGFTTIAKAAARAEGMTDLRIAEYPGAVGVHPEALVVKNVTEVLFDRIVEGLTRPVGANEKHSSASSRAADAAEYEGTFEDINEHFREREWTDQLPIVPPTRDRVEVFLRHTRRSPDETIAVLPQANLRAVPRNIAANAIMAGCRPDAMPLLIAAVEAIADNAYNLNNIGSTWGVLPFLLVNGPAIESMGLESGAHLISKGENPALGRAFGLIIRNIAGYKLGRNYMGTFGYPLCFTLAENEKDSPWEPYHVEHGFGREESAVTAGGTVTWGWPPAIYGTPDKTAAQSALEFLAIEITKKPCLARLAERGAQGFRNMITILLAPPIAKALAAAGYTKQKIRDYLYEHARVPYRELEFLLKYGHSEAFTIPDAVRVGVYPEEYLVGPDELVRVVPSPETIHIVVCGDPHRNRAMVLWGGYVNPVTKKIDCDAH
ncbi:MAG TPA: hypothetical protein VFZ14_12185 [Burkholderiales bacterium]|nr:hypothetical protein [Burkholderiales bacterium]